MKNMLRVLTVAGCVLGAVEVGIAQDKPQNPQVILQSEWLVEHDGQDPAAPWQVRGEQFGRVVLDASRRGLTAADRASVRIEDANREGLGPSLGGTFAEPVNGSLRILFDFQLEAGATNQPTMVLEDSSGKAGLFLALNNNSFPLSIRGSNIINRSGSLDGQLIHPLRADTWYRVELLVWPPQVGRYTATVTQHGGEPMRVEGLPFREILSDYGAIRFMSNTNKGAGSLNVANVTVERDIDIRLAGDPQSVERRTVRETSVLHVDPAAAAGGDGSAVQPFATLGQAREQIREWHRNGMYPSGGVVVELAAGDHFRTETVELQQQDSGLWNAPVIYRAAAGATARIIGGRSFQLADFEPVSDQVIRARLPEAARDHIRQLNLRTKGISNFGELPLYGHSMFFLEKHTQWQRGSQGSELFVDEQPMTLARYPNQGFNSVGRVIDGGDNVRLWMDDMRGRPGWVPEDQRNNPAKGFAFQHSDQERLQLWQMENDLRLHGYWSNNFSDQALQVREVDAAAGIVRTVQPSAYTVRSGQRFYAYNALCELDSPGEWYIDRESGILYLYPPENTT